MVGVFLGVTRGSKRRVSSAAAILAVVLTGCTSGSRSGRAVPTWPSHMTAAAPSATTVDRRWAPLGWPHTPTGTELVFGADVGPARRLLDVDRRSSRTVRLDVGYPRAEYRRWQSGPLFGELVLAGGRVVYSAAPKNGAAPAVLYSSPSWTGQARRLPGSAPYFAARRPGAVWVTSAAGGHRFVELDASSGRPLAYSGPIPAAAVPVAELPAGVLVQAFERNGVTLRLDTRAVATGRLIRNLTTSAASYDGLIAVSGDLVAWQSAHCLHCAVHLTNPANGKDRVVTPPPGFGGACITGAFSPNARTLALLAGCPRGGYQDGVAIVDVATGHTQFIPRTHDAEEPLRWGGHNDWLFWEGQANPNGFVAMLAYRLGAATPTRFPAAPPAPLIDAVAAA